ncbi:MAG: hypothetical protein P8185_04925 [Deltaproteobacteria bacterium]
MKPLLNNIHACQCSMKLLFIHKIENSVNAQQRLSAPVPVFPVMEKTDAANAAEGNFLILTDLFLAYRHERKMKRAKNEFTTKARKDENTKNNKRRLSRKSKLP